MKTVQELSDSRVYVVLNKKHEHVATVQVRWGSGYGVQCDVWSRTASDGWLRLAHQKKAGGGGYDKPAAAMSGAVIEGYQLADHCGYVEAKGERQRKALMRAYRKARDTALPFDADHDYPRSIDKQFEAKACKIGARWTNYDTEKGWGSLYFESGLGRLVALGFTVINAL